MKNVVAAMIINSFAVGLSVSAAIAAGFAGKTGWFIFDSIVVGFNLSLLFLNYKYWKSCYEKY